MEVQVSFSSDGEAVLGVLHVPDRAPAPGLIMCHGFTGHKGEAHRLFVEAARDFCSHGMVVLRFDFRGSGDSAGEFRDMTVSREIADAAAAFEFLASRSEADAERVGVLGLSLGGCVAACLAGRESRVKALVLWAPLAQPRRIQELMAPELGSDEVFDMQGWAVGRGLLDDARDLEPLKEVQEYHAPSLVVHGTEDEAVPPSDGSDFRIALGGLCRLHLIQKSDHVFSSLAWKAEAIQVSREFLVESLGPASVD